ncbi:hypothetical protein EDO6_00081 [Paenibacillus xylanexedens]|nr:hypothetical protein EDO6_00081 [Paenibacillus xylanexedens]
MSGLLTYQVTCTDYSLPASARQSFFGLGMDLNEPFMENGFFLFGTDYI